MTTEKKYMIDKENEGYNKLLQLNEKYKWFKTIEKMPDYSHYDAKAIDMKDRTCVIEIKTRDIGLYDYPTIFIEQQKFRNLQFHGVNYKPVYINFFKDGDFCVWNLNKFKEEDLNLSIVDVTMKETGKTIKKAKRLNLKINDGFIGSIN